MLQAVGLKRMARSQPCILIPFLHPRTTRSRTRANWISTVTSGLIFNIAIWPSRNANPSHFCACSPSFLAISKAVFLSRSIIERNSDGGMY